MTKEAFQYALAQISAPKGRALWLYGEPGLAVGDTYHPWQAQAQALEQGGCKVFSDYAAVGDNYNAIYLNAPQQREEVEGLMALALQRSQGLVMAAAANDAGGKRLAAMMEAFGVQVHQLSKDKCRVVWTFDAPKADKHHIQSSLAFLPMQQVTVGDATWWSVPGLFAWNKIDPGSQFLLQHLPPELAGRVADFGCGYGYLSTALLKRYPAIIHIDAYDADARAVATAARNGGAKLKAYWQDIHGLQVKKQYDAVVMNPPFHSGKEEDFALGQTFIRRAWESLKPGGRLFMVANRTLPYEKIVPGITIAASDKGYKILTGQAA